MTRLAAVALAFVVVTCRTQQQQQLVNDSVPQPAAPVVIAPPSAADSTKVPDDSTLFRITRDSIALLEKRVDGLGNHPSAAAILFQVGLLKRLMTGYPYSAGGGEEYAEARPDDYIYNQPGGHYIYNGNDWKRLVELFPSDSLVDDVSWHLAQMWVQRGDCEGYVPCILHRDFKPFLDFLMRFPDSRYASDAVRAANDHLKSILRDDADLHLEPDPDYTPLESLLARYDSSAMRLKPSLRDSVYAVTKPLRERIGQPVRR